MFATSDTTRGRGVWSGQTAYFPIVLQASCRLSAPASAAVRRAWRQERGATASPSTAGRRRATASPSILWETHHTATGTNTLPHSYTPTTRLPTAVPSQRHTCPLARSPNHHTHHTHHPRRKIFTVRVSLSQHELNNTFPPEVCSRLGWISFFLASLSHRIVPAGRLYSCNSSSHCNCVCVNGSVLYTHTPLPPSQLALHLLCDEAIQEEEEEEERKKYLHSHGGISPLIE